MASLWKRSNSQYFIACWTDANGRRWKRSTKTKVRKDAIKLAHEFESESRKKRTATQIRKIMADIYKSHSGETVPITTVSDYFKSFINGKRPEVSPATLAYYEGHSRRFLAWLGPRAAGDIANISKSDITGYRNHVAKSAGARTTNNTLKAVRAFFSAARKDNFLVEDPAADVATVRDRSESTRRPFTLEELRKVLVHANDEWRSMILFGLYTGQRLGDIATLTKANIDLPRVEIRLVTRKTGRRQVLPLAPPLRALIEKLADSQASDPKAPLHPAAFALMNRVGRAGTLSKQFGELLESAGLRASKTEPEEGNARAKHELSFHSLRHTATSLLKAAGIPQSVVMAFVGHESTDVSQGYTHTDREALEKAAAALPQL